MIINALICDDDINCSNVVAQFLDKYCEDNSIVCTCNLFDNGQKALESTDSYNIAFLDIEIGDVSGLEIAKKLKDQNKNIIIFFITDYEKYIDDAMDLFALRFIKKPLEYERFCLGLDKAIELINDETIDLFLKEADSFKKIKTKDIIYLEIENRKVKIVTVEGVHYSVEPIDYWEKQLTQLV